MADISILANIGHYHFGMTPYTFITIEFFIKTEITMEMKRLIYYPRLCFT